MNKLISVKQNEKKMDLFDDNDNYCESIEDSLCLDQPKQNTNLNNNKIIENEDINTEEKKIKKKDVIKNQKHVYHAVHQILVGVF